MFFSGKHKVTTVQICIMKLFRTIYLFFNGAYYKADAKMMMMMVFSQHIINMQEVLGIAHCLACKFRKFSNNERVALPRGKHVGALPLTPVCRASKTKQTFRMFQKARGEKTTWRKKALSPSQQILERTMKYFMSEQRRRVFFKKKWCLIEISKKKICYKLAQMIVSNLTIKF